MILVPDAHPPAKRQPERESTDTDSTGSVAYPAPVISPIEVSVLLPCLNEAETLEVCIRKAQGSLARLGVAGEVVVADNGSTDGSQEIAKRLGARVVAVPVRGYGAALYAGIEAARGELVVMADADDSYELSNLGPFIAKLREGYDLVMGNRFAGGIAPGAMPPLHRYLGNPVLTAVGRLFFRSPVRDFHCGMRGFRREAALRMGLRTTGMEFASEMVVKATLMRLRVAEVPTVLSPDGRSRAPHLHSWHDGWRHLRFLLMYSPRYLFLVPGVLLMLVGLVCGAALTLGPVRVGGVQFDVNTLLFCSAAMILGSQAVLFYMFSKVFAIGEGLLPADLRLLVLFRYITLEVGLIVGTLALLTGLGGALAAVAHWRSAGYGPLEATSVLRLVIPSVTLLVLGAEAIMGSFFLSVLGLRRR